VLWVSGFAICAALANESMAGDRRVDATADGSSDRDPAGRQ